jgi:protein transport protein SEC23
MVFMGGPPTVGPGMAVSEDLKEPIRSHHELRKETAKYFHQATKVCSATGSHIVR